MRLTVGPLPPAVYWRRRAVVLGSMLLVIIMLAYSCGDAKGSDPASQQSGDKTSSAPDTGTDGTVGATSPTGTPPSSDAPAPADTETAEPAGAATTAGTPATADSNLCTDDEMMITPAPESQQLPRGATMSITIKIKNKSKRTCSRDVGADLQELYMMQRGSAQKIWSSDDCGSARGNKVESFTSNFERSYTVNWNGRASTKCGSIESRPIPEAGEYQLYARLGTKRSAPVAITLT